MSLFFIRVHELSQKALAPPMKNISIALYAQQTTRSVFLIRIFSYIYKFNIESDGLEGV